jgi:hypothetical protein
VSSEDNGVVDGDSDFGSSKGNGAAGIAQLSHGDEGGGGELGDGSALVFFVRSCKMFLKHHHGCSSVVLTAPRT